MIGTFNAEQVSTRMMAACELGEHSHCPNVLLTKAKIGPNLVDYCDCPCHDDEREYKDEMGEPTNPYDRAVYFGDPHPVEIYVASTFDHKRIS